MNSLKEVVHKIGQHRRTVKCLLHQLSKPQGVAACGAPACCAFSVMDRIGAYRAVNVRSCVSISNFLQYFYAYAT